MNTRLLRRHCAIGDASVPMRANECLVPVGPVTQRRGLKLLDQSLMGRLALAASARNRLAQPAARHFQPESLLQYGGHLAVGQAQAFVQFGGQRDRRHQDHASKHHRPAVRGREPFTEPHRNPRLRKAAIIACPLRLGVIVVSRTGREPERTNVARRDDPEKLRTFRQRIGIGRHLAFQSLNMRCYHVA
jgi:hypothetical protein